MRLNNAKFMIEKRKCWWWSEMQAYTTITSTQQVATYVSLTLKKKVQKFSNHSSGFSPHKLLRKLTYQRSHYHSNSCTLFSSYSVHWISTALSQIHFRVHNRKRKEDFNFSSPLCALIIIHNWVCSSSLWKWILPFDVIKTVCYMNINRNSFI